MTKSTEFVPRLRLLFFVLLFCTGWSVVVFAQGDVLILKDQGNQTEHATNDSKSTEEQSAEEAPTPASFQEFYDRWRDLQDAIGQGNTADAETLLSQIVGLRKHSTIPKMTEFAMSAIQIGDQLAAKDKLEDALKFYRAASDLDPSLAYAFFSESKAQMARGPVGYVPAVMAALRGLFAPGSTIIGKMYFQSRWLLILVATGALAGFVFALILLIKYNRLLRHDAVERSRKDSSLVQLFVWALLFLPLLLFLGPLWLAPFWFMLLWGYCKPAEKVLAVFFFGVYFLAYPAYQHVAQLSEAISDPRVAPYLKAFTEGASPAVVRDFEEYAAKHSEDTDGDLLLACLYKNEAQYDSAIGVLQKIMVEHPADARPFNNLANIYFVQGETDSALRFLDKAFNLNERNAIIVYNQSKAYRAKFNFVEAERLLEQARAMDPSLISKLESGTTDQLVDIIPEEDTLWNRINARVKPFPGLFANPFSALTVGLFVMTFVINLGKRKRRGFAHKCLKCGKPFCKKCQSSSQTYEFCTQCLHIFVKKDGVSPASRKEKMQEIEQYSDRKRWSLRISSLLLPGSGNLLGNATVSGIVVMVLWVLFIVLLSFNSRYSFLSIFEPGENTAALSLFYGFGMAVLYAIANIPFFLRPQRA